MERITILKRKWVDYMEKEKTTPVQEESCCCCHKKKERDEKEYKDLMNRLSRIEGARCERYAGTRCLLCGYSDTGGSYQCSAEQF